MNTFDLSIVFFKRKLFNASICFFYVTPLFDISPFFCILDTEIPLTTRRTLEGGRQGREPPQASDADRDRPDSGLRYGDPPEDEERAIAEYASTMPYASVQATIRNK